jgi:hypothetical protein
LIATKEKAEEFIILCLFSFLCRFRRSVGADGFASILMTKVLLSCDGLSCNRAGFPIITAQIIEASLLLHSFRFQYTLLNKPLPRPNHFAETPEKTL